MSSIWMRLILIYHKEGCYVASPPTGYKNTRTDTGKSTLAVIEDKAALIRNAFNDYAKGVDSSEDVRRRYYHKGLKISKQTMLNIFRNPVYLGKIKIKAWKKEDEMIVEGLHPAIIDEETFRIVQFRLAGIQPKQVHKFSEIDEMLPLRGHLICRSCGRILTGSASKGGSGIRYFYYHCHPGCKERFKAQEANEIFEQVLKEMIVRDDVKKLYKEILDKVFHGEEQGRVIHLKQINAELEKLSTRLISMEKKFLDDLIDASTYNSMKRRTQEKTHELLAEKEGIENLKKDIEEYLKLGISFLQGVDVFYANASVDMKKKIISLIFPEKLIFLRKSYRTFFLDELI